ncbi:MAG TPA: hypothetical protein DD723_07450 [Candidatus Omnitrophica bacterium]|nr:MAG: hypothetical protein A2Z81_09360 [Omnitrophica WOR_2 bacterium GWA2_45_18]HBR15361.1 hypothetical protein [Candidatus Omnitrophota bacterium]
MENEEKNDLVFQHLIDLPNYDCVFCSTRDRSTGKTLLFLIFNDEKRIYIRNGRREAWDELKDKRDYYRVRLGLDNAIEERKIPCFEAGSLWSEDA